MKTLSRPLCSWCGTDYKRTRSHSEPPLCPSCHAQLSNTPTETLLQIIAQLAIYNQVALRLLVEGHEGIEQVRSGLAPTRERHPKKSRVPPAAEGLARSVA